jgi:hypothetical protein
VRWWQTDTGQDRKWKWMEHRELTYVDAPSPFMIRYILIATPWGDIKVHNILRPDHGRDMHDHPWPFLAVILRGGYTEQVPERWVDGQPKGIKKQYRGRGSVYRVPATYVHRIHSLYTKPATWSLVLTGKRCREWGYWAETGWVDWKTYGASADRQKTEQN